MSGVRETLLILAAMLCMFMTACSFIKHERPVESSLSDLAAADHMGQMDDVMEFYDYVRKQPPSELGRIYDKAKHSFTQNKSDENRARLVLLLILPNTSFRDAPSALHLLNEWPRDAKPGNNLQSFKTLLVSLLAEQQRLHHSVEELSQKLKDEQKRVETLQSQIDAIKSMEKNLLKQL